MKVEHFHFKYIFSMFSLLTFFAVFPLFLLFLGFTSVSFNLFRFTLHVVLQVQKTKIRRR